MKHIQLFFFNLVDLVDINTLLCLGNEHTTISKFYIRKNLNRSLTFSCSRFSNGPAPGRKETLSLTQTGIAAIQSMDLRLCVFNGV